MKAISLSYIDALQRANSDAVAFYPKAALERGIDEGLFDVGYENGEPGGYLYRSRPATGRTLHIWQAVIDYDLRRRKVGTDLVAGYIAAAIAKGAAAVELRCRSSIPANDFWRAMGFECVSVGAGGRKRGADINTWRLDLWPSLFRITETPSEQGEDQAEYRRLKASGFVFPSRFSLPGKQLLAALQ